MFESDTLITKTRKVSAVVILKGFEPYELKSGLIALKKRLPPYHEKYPLIVEDLNKMEAGEKGEAHVFNLLNSYPLAKNTVLLHNVSLNSNIQFDILVISPSWCLILEVKNIKGSLYFNHNPKQLIRMSDEGKEENLGSPETQVEIYMRGLRALLDKLRINIPIYGAIVFAFQNVIIKKSPSTVPAVIGRELISYIGNLPIQENKVDPYSLGRNILQQVKARNVFPLCQEYTIGANEIIKGVECPSCETFSMLRTLRTWYCKNCEKTYNRAHERALADYSMLINDKITNKECVQFLNLKNHQVATRILKANSTARMGHNRNSVYVLKNFKDILNG